MYHGYKYNAFSNNEAAKLVVTEGNRRQFILFVHNAVPNVSFPEKKPLNYFFSKNGNT